MIDLNTLNKLKIADKALTKARIQMVRLCMPISRGEHRKKINVSKLYDQVGVGYITIAQILEDEKTNE